MSEMDLLELRRDVINGSTSTTTYNYCNNSIHLLGLSRSTSPSSIPIFLFFKMKSSMVALALCTLSVNGLPNILKRVTDSGITNGPSNNPFWML